VGERIPHTPGKEGYLGSFPPFRGRKSLSSRSVRGKKRKKRERPFARPKETITSWGKGIYRCLEDETIVRPRRYLFPWAGKGIYSLDLRDKEEEGV